MGVGSTESAASIVSPGSLFLYDTDSGLTRMMFDTNGNVGIGTTSPQRKLSIVTSTNSDGIQIRRKSDTANEYASLAFRTNTTEGNTNYGEIRSVRTNRAIGGDSDLALLAFTNGAQIEGIRIRDNGNVGIGTTTPDSKLTVYKSATNIVSSSGGNLDVLSDNSSVAVLSIKGTGTADLVNVFDNTTEVFTILDGGNVGIGVNSPTQKLEVYGNSKARDYIISDSSDVAKASIKYDSTSKSIKFVFV
jgi:hypothetical protein